MLKNKDNASSIKKAAEKKQPLNKEEQVDLARKALPLLFMGEGLRGSPVQAKIALARQERHDLIQLPSLVEDIKDRLRRVRGKTALSLSGYDLSKICFALWEAMVGLNDEPCGQLESRATGVTNWVMHGLNEVVSQHAASMCSVSLSAAQRRVISEMTPQFARKLKLDEKNARKIEFTLAECNQILQKAVAELRTFESGMKRNSLQGIVITLISYIGDYQGFGSIPKSQRIFQFKITLLDSKPPIWRRIQVKDCTLDKLHEHIQTAMGWTNSHLHHFRVGEQLYGDPDLMGENFEDLEYKDSTSTKLSDILPRTGQRFSFEYEYDFGDGWQHEVLFEGCVRAEQGKRHPVCLEGERACPPEDVGGVWGYAEFVEAIQDPENEQHDEFLTWVGGRFDPEEFDPEKATKRMRRGLPNWREWV